MSKKVKTANARKSRPSKTLPDSGETMYWLLADIKNVGLGADDYKYCKSIVKLWIKAKSEEAAVATAKRWLIEGGWQLKGHLDISEVSAGVARIGSLLDPPIFTDAEADEWTDHFMSANTNGLDYEFAHYPRTK